MAQIGTITMRMWRLELATMRILVIQLYLQKSFSHCLGGNERLGTNKVCHYGAQSLSTKEWSDYCLQPLRGQFVTFQKVEMSQSSYNFFVNEVYFLGTQCLKQ